MKKYLAVYGKPRYLGLVEYDGDIKKCTRVVVESVRGEELALVVGEIDEQQEAEYRLLKNTSEHGDGMMKSSEPVVTDLTFMAFATDEDCETADAYREEEKTILCQAKELLKPHNLEMKLIDVEFLMAKRKLFFYFSSDQRVDFRAYVRDLAREFKTRIELRQVGVRDEAKIIRGVGPCGRPCCCSYWLNQFAPICIKMVKEQNLALNPAKISGICGRLMCCMCYEYEVYHEAWEGFPNPGSKIKTPSGNIIVSGIDLHTKCLRCSVPGKGEVKVPHDRFEEFKAVVSSGEEWAPAEEQTEDPDVKMRDIFSYSQQVFAGLQQPDRQDAAADAAEDEGNSRRDGEHRRARKRRKPGAHRDAVKERDDSAEALGLPPKFGQGLQQDEDVDKKSGGRPRRHFQRRRKPSSKKDAGGDSDQ